eukprot:scaffold2816_cov121-Cylindrotheca_fusiformis.AAC.29
MSIVDKAFPNVNMQNQQAGKVKVVAGYALQQRLGSGSFATVYKGVKVSSQADSSESDTGGDSSQPDDVAIKAISRTSEKLTKKVLQNLEIEISILRTYRHPNIVCMHDVQKTERHFYLILEYCGGGDVQRLIRTRKAGRLSERLTRRLVRDLASGLRFLWGQELIHRDIKPQNLLLTGALPLDETDDPENSPAAEEKRRQIDFPSHKFSLKIADFGFARHLQTASLAETLCGSPLYMAPEILQHHRYDAKADLWSVGTVLFEMIAGRPPFNGENHIDLLRNIQRKAVRLPPDVRISKPCVTLLRVLLNRNPLSRAGFKEFFEACDAFIALGCEGVATQDAGSRRIPTKDLGTIHENDGASSNSGSESLMTVATMAPSSGQPPSSNTTPLQPNMMGSPSFPSRASPPNIIPAVESGDSQQALTRHYTNKLTPLTQSPPSSGQMAYHSSKVSTVASVNQPKQLWAQNQYNTESTNATRRNEMSQSQASSDDSGFVMVEHGGNSRNDLLDAAGGQMNMIGQRHDVRGSPATQSSPLYYINSASALGSPGNPTIGMGERKPSKGMLSTSPGTGGFLMGLYGRAQRIGYDNSADDAKFGDQIETANKMITASEDVGRRAVSVAHLGDARAYLGMRLAHSTEDESSQLSAAPMEGVEGDGNEYDSGSTEIMVVSRRRSSVSIDKVMTDPIAEEEEMPFAISPDAPAVSLPSRSNHSIYSKGSSMTGPRKIATKPDPQTIRSHLGEALSCYLKALKMLKSAVGATQRVSKDLENLMTQTGRSPTNYDIPNMKKRCEVTSAWLRVQFRGVLERAEAANIEISKFSPVAGEKGPSTVISVEELIYNHALASGRDAAVKQLLGQYEAARTCYRSAGLLAETLLMEPTIGAEDRKILEGYVDGFATRINELDQLMLQQSRMASSSATSPAQRGSSVIGLIGPPAPLPSGFMVPHSLR